MYIDEQKCINCGAISGTLGKGVDELKNDFCRHCGSDEGFEDYDDPEDIFVEEER